MTTTLLIISCSHRKRHDAGLLPAIQRYDGPAFRMLRKLRRDGLWPAGLQVLVLSARYGLIHTVTPIADYDLRMTPRRAREIMPHVGWALQMDLDYYQPSQVYICLGAAYRQSIPINVDYDCFAQDVEITWAKGAIGRRLAQLYRWLHGLRSANQPQIAALRPPSTVLRQGAPPYVMHLPIHPSPVAVVDCAAPCKG